MPSASLDQTAGELAAGRSCRAQLLVGDINHPHYGARGLAVQRGPMDDRIQQGRDPEWRLAFEDRLDGAAQARVRRAVKDGASVSDPDEAAIAVGLARREVRTSFVSG